MTENMTRKKFSSILSAVFMGAGQIYNGAYIQGALLGLVELIALFNLGNIRHGLWGLYTLGEVAQKRQGFDIIQGDHSIYLLVEGIFTVVLLLMLAALYVYNIKDAGRRGEEKERRSERPEGEKGFVAFIDRNFKVVMLTPGAFGLIFFVLLPIVITAAIAFTNYAAPDHIPPRNLVDWVGFETFGKLFSMKIWQSTMMKLAIWNVIWAIVATITTYSMGLLLAILLEKKHIVGKSVWRTIFILPYAIPAFVSLLTFRLLLNGLGPINNLLSVIGIGQIPFLTDPTYARLTVILINIWISAPFFMVLLSGSLTNISSALYEAADIDGASKFEQFRHITLPMVLFQTAPVLIMQFAFNFNNFGAVYLVTEGGPVNSSLRYAGDTDILVSWLFKLTLNQNQFNMAAVVSLILFGFISIFSIYSFMHSSSFKQEGMI